MGSTLVCSLWVFLLTTHRQLCGGFMFGTQQSKEDLTSSSSAQFRYFSKGVTQRGLLAPTFWYTKAFPSFSPAGSSFPFQYDDLQRADEATDVMSLQDLESSDFHDFVAGANSQMGVQKDVSRKKQNLDLVTEVLGGTSSAKRRNEGSSAAGTFPRQLWPRLAAGEKTDKTDHLLQSILDTMLTRSRLPSDSDVRLALTFADNRGGHRRMMRNSESLNEGADNSGASFPVPQVDDSLLSSEYITGPSRPVGERTDGAEGVPSGLGSDDTSDSRPAKKSFADVMGDDEPASDDSVDLSSFLVMDEDPTLAPGSTPPSSELLPTPPPAPTRRGQVPTPAPTPKPWPRFSSNPISGETTVHAVPTPPSEYKATSVEVGVNFWPEVLGNPLEGGSAGDTRTSTPRPGLMLPPGNPSREISSNPCQQLDQPIIVNGSIPCGRRRRRNTALTPHHLSRLLRQLGGSDSSPFTAVTIEEARRKFRNMLPLGIPEKDVYLYEKYSTSQLQQILEEYYARSNGSAEDVPAKLKLTDKNVAGEWNNASRQSQKRWSGSYQDSDGDNALDGLPWLSDVHFPLEFLQLMVPASHVMGHRTRFVKRAAETYEGNYCTSTTEEIPGGFLNLCSACQVTTFLGDDIFPHVLNEIVCNPSNEDRRCLSFQGATHGSCDQAYLHVQMLRRQTGRCMKITLEGENMLTDRWELYSQQVRIGCECKMDKRSPLLTGALVG